MSVVISALNEEKNVVAVLTKVLDVYAPQYPDSIGKFFLDNAWVIDDMFAHSLPWLETHDEWNGKEVDHKALAAVFRAKWEDFKNRIS